MAFIKKVNLKNFNLNCTRFKKGVLCCKKLYLRDINSRLGHQRT